jgi:phenylalanyl-tRNA synthetase beta subunit
MKVMETQLLGTEKAPKCCSFCDEENKFLMVKPAGFLYNGQTFINRNHTNSPLWMCLECLRMELDALGHSVDIQEY